MSPTNPTYAETFADEVTELFHPDMNFPDIVKAIKALLALHESAKGSPPSSPLRWFEHVARCDEALWTDRPTQLEKDEALRVGAGWTGGVKLKTLFLMFPGMEMPAVLDEIQRLQRSDRNVTRLGQEHVLIKWDEYRDRALQQPTLVDALAMVSVWDTENAVHQAMRNAPEEKRILPHGALWETHSASYIGEVLDRWKGPLLATQPTPVAHKLWDLLDDIDSASDAIKPRDLDGYRRFYSRALDTAKKRHTLLVSNGYALTEPAAPPREPLAILLDCPVCHARHIDVGKFATKPHTTHACQACGHVWKPSKEPTVGVQFLPGYQNELTGKALVGKRVRVLTPLDPNLGYVPLGATHLVTKFDGPYGDVNQERYEVLMGTYALSLRREDFEAL